MIGPATAAQALRKQAVISSLRCELSHRSRAAGAALVQHHQRLHKSIALWQQVQAVCAA